MSFLPDSFFPKKNLTKQKSANFEAATASQLRSSSIKNGKARSNSLVSLKKNEMFISCIQWKNGKNDFAKLAEPVPFEKFMVNQRDENFEENSFKFRINIRMPKYYTKSENRDQINYTFLEMLDLSFLQIGDKVKQRIEPRSVIKTESSSSSSSSSDSGNENDVERQPPIANNQVQSEIETASESGDLSFETLPEEYTNAMKEKYTTPKRRIDALEKKKMMQKRIKARLQRRREVMHDRFAGRSISTPISGNVSSSTPSSTQTKSELLSSSTRSDLTTGANQSTPRTPATPSPRTDRSGQLETPNRPQTPSPSNRNPNPIASTPVRPNTLNLLNINSPAPSRNQASPAVTPPNDRSNKTQSSSSGLASEHTTSEREKTLSPKARTPEASAQNTSMTNQQKTNSPTSPKSPRSELKTEEILNKSNTMSQAELETYARLTRDYDENVFLFHPNPIKILNECNKETRSKQENVSFKMILPTEENESKKMSENDSVKLTVCSIQDKDQIQKKRLFVKKQISKSTLSTIDVDNSSNYLYDNILSGDLSWNKMENFMCLDDHENVIKMSECTITNISQVLNCLKKFILINSNEKHHSAESGKMLIEECTEYTPIKIDDQEAAFVKIQDKIKSLNEKLLKDMNKDNPIDYVLENLSLKKNSTTGFSNTSGEENRDIILGFVSKQHPTKIKWEIYKCYLIRNIKERLQKLRNSEESLIVALVKAKKKCVRYDLIKTNRKFEIFYQPEFVIHPKLTKYTNVSINNTEGGASGNVSPKSPKSPVQPSRCEKSNPSSLLTKEELAQMEHSESEKNQKNQEALEQIKKMQSVLQKMDQKSPKSK